MSLSISVSIQFKIKLVSIQHINSCAIVKSFQIAQRHIEATKLKVTLEGFYSEVLIMFFPSEFPNTINIAVTGHFLQILI